MRLAPVPVVIASLIVLPALAADKPPERIKINWSHKPASEAMVEMAATAKVPLHVNWKALADVGIEPNAEISLQGYFATPAQAFRLIVRQLNSTANAQEKAKTHDIMRTIVAQNGPGGSVEVTTLKDACSSTDTLILNLGELLMDIPNFTDAPSFDLVSALSNTNSGGGGNSKGNGALLKNFSEAKTAETRAERAEALAKQLRIAIAPGIWKEDGADTECTLTVRTDGVVVIKAPQCILQEFK